MTAADLPPGLGPWCVGVRVVVRRVLPGETGPSGGPALTDLLGILEEWGRDTVTVRPERGDPVVIERRHIVSGKPVPPRPSVRLRLGAEEVARRTAPTWPAVEQAHLGDWLLRASAGFSLRANSALPLGDPGRPWDAAVAAVTAFYGARGLPVVVQAVTGSDAALRLVAEGWVDARPGMVEVVVQVAGVAQALRAVRRELGAALEEPQVRLDERVSEGWLATDPRTRAHGAVALAVLEGPSQVTFASVRGPGGALLARGRAALTEGPDVWVGVSDVWVDPARRRQRLGHAVLRALLGWAAERGATTAFLQVAADNDPALALYERLGFVAHHGYRYLTPPPPPTG